ncbi:MAG: hypothetical protein KBF33_11530, partial [Comamonas sp.]|nr:hypothetical protein [Comamonas sp.]
MISLRFQKKKVERHHKYLKKASRFHLSKTSTKVHQVGFFLLGLCLQLLALKGCTRVVRAHELRKYFFVRLPVCSCNSMIYMESPALGWPLIWKYFQVLRLMQTGECSVQSLGKEKCC